MALFKILKGPEKKDSTGKSVMLDPVASGLAIKEGWAYVTDAGNFYVDISDTTRVKINQNADYANIAYNDSANQPITSTYIKEISFLTDNNSQTGAASNPYLKYLLGNNTPKVLALPAASSTHGGILTLDRQELMGLKIFWDGIRQTAKIPEDNANYSVGYYRYGMLQGKLITSPLNLGGLTYNPSTKTLNADNFSGLAAKATADASDQTITSTYIKDIKYFADESNPYYTLILGNGTTKLDPNDTTGKTIEKITIPVADTTNAGIVTINAQTFAGEKTFNSLITATSGLYSKDNITTEKQFISTIATGTAPFQVASSTVVSGLNADMIDGLHASNTPFTSGSASQTILPTQHAIWTSFNSLLTAAQALVYRGTIDPKNSNTHPTSGLVNGDTYVITAEGNFAGVYCEPGDLAIYCNSSWDIIQVNINGAVTIKDGGAYNTAHTTDHAIARFDGTTGRIIQNSSILIDDSGNVLPITDKKQTIGSATAIWGTIYGTATHATSDDKNQNIAATYIKEIEFVQSDATHPGSTSNPALKFLRGTGVNPIFLSIPAAGPQQGGIITAEAQEISGVKTLNATDGGLIIPRADSFQYSGVQEDTATGTTKYIWFSSVDDSLPKIKGIPKYNPGLAFNPSCVDPWGSYDSGKVTAYKVITTDRFNGLSLKALQDDQGQVIKNFYLQDVVLNTSVSAPYYTLKLGNGLFKDTDGTSGADKVIIPVASTTQAGVITADTNNTQTITGAKIIDSNGSLEIQEYNGFNFSGIKLASGEGERKVWFSRRSASGTPRVSDSFTFNPNETLNTTNWSNEKSGTKSAVLHVPHIDGLAYKALRDSQGLVIADTYIKEITYADYKFTIKLGNGLPLTNSPLAPLFAASSSCGGDALKAVRWSNAVTIKLTGEVTGSATIAGNEGTINIATSLANTNLSTLNEKYLRKDQADSTNYTLTLNNTTDLNTTLTTAQGALIVKGGVHVAKQLYASKVYNSVWNDYAECRKAETLEPGRVIIEDASGEMKLSSERLQPGGSIISDTYGHSMGYTEECKTPVAVAGRVLAYYDGDVNMYTVGAAVGTGPNGTVSLMTREEIMTYPDRIIGIVSEIPSYEEWGPEHIKVNGRIWIKIK